MVRQTLFRGTVVVIGVGTTAMRFCSREEKLGSTQYDKEKWEFILKEQDWGGRSVDGKLPRRNIRGKWCSG